MRMKHLIICSTALIRCYVADAHCIDIHSRIVSQGLHYVPGGTNPCTLCICDKGGPKWCKSVLCSPPQNCKSFQVGSSCCEFKCLDDILSGHESYKETYEVALRFIASTVTAILSISLLFFLYNRLKRNKALARHNHHHEDHQRTMAAGVGYIGTHYPYNQTSIGFLAARQHDLAIRFEDSSANYALWKPPGSYFPPGEAPPPYEEAMRVPQTTSVTQNIASAMSANGVAATTTNHNENHQYVNVRMEPVPVLQYAPKKQHAVQEASYENISTLNRNVAERLAHRMERNNWAAVNRAHGERPTTHSPRICTSRSSSALIEHCTLSLSKQPSGNMTTLMKCANRPNTNHDKKDKTRNDIKMNRHRTLPKNLREFLSQADNTMSSIPCTSTSSNCDTPPTSKSHQPTTVTPTTFQQSHGILTFEGKQKCLLAYQSLSQDEDDYRSECENCKTHRNAEVEECLQAGVNETMSLQRRPLTETSNDMEYRTSLTLPTNSKKHRGYPGNRENWFAVVHPSSSDESE